MHVNILVGLMIGKRKIRSIKSSLLTKNGVCQLYKNIKVVEKYAGRFYVLHFKYNGYHNQCLSSRKT